MPSPSDRVYLRIRDCGDGDDETSPSAAARSAAYSGDAPQRSFKLPLEAKFEMLLSAIDADDSTSSRGSSTTSRAGGGNGGGGSVLQAPSASRGQRRSLMWGSRALHEWETPAGVGMQPGAGNETELRIERRARDDAPPPVVLCDASLPVHHAASASTVHVPVRIEVCTTTQIPRRVRAIPPPGFRIALGGPCDHEGFVPALDRTSGGASTPVKGKVVTPVEAATATSAYLRALQETFAAHFPFEEAAPSAEDAESTLRFDTAIDVKPGGGTGTGAVRVPIELVLCKAFQRPLCVRVVPPPGYRVALDGPCDVDGYIEQLDRRRRARAATATGAESVTVVDYLRQVKSILTDRFPFAHEKTVPQHHHSSAAEDGATVEVTLPLHRSTDGAAMSVAAELELCPTYTVPLRVRVRPPPGYRIAPIGPCDADGFVPGLDRTAASAAALAALISTAGTPEHAATAYVRELAALLAAAFPFETITQATQRRQGDAAAAGSPRTMPASPGGGGVPGTPDGRSSEGGSSMEQSWSPANEMTPKD